jgi:hypothetical protein
MKHFSKYFFVYTILPLLVLSVAASYFRFIFTTDYLVSFEGWCDQESESCFVNSYFDEECEYDTEDGCTIEYTYKLVKKPVSDFMYQIAQCSENTFLDPMECEIVDVCGYDEPECSIEYCDQEKSSSECSFISDANVGNQEEK